MQAVLLADIHPSDILEKRSKLDLMDEPDQIK